MADTAFRLHSAARLHDAAGQPAPLHAAPAPVIAPRPAAAALVQAFAAAAAGTAFRVGAVEAPPPATQTQMFETLTSGSTGAPRRVRRSHGSWTASFAVNARLFGIGPGTVVAVPGRLDQSLALYGAIEALHLGAALHLLDGLRPDRQAQALATRRVEVLYATPAQLRLLTEADAPPAPALRLVLSGGATLDPATRAGLADRFPNAAIREFYGTAEASFIALADDATPPGAVGRPYPGVEIDLAGGEVRVRSPYVFDGYAGEAAWPGGWLSTGEIGRLDAGHLVLAGRADRMVTVADHNVHPEEVEAFLMSLPGVTRAAALPRPDARRGHVIEAAVTGGSDAQILAACRSTLGPLKAPRRLHRPAHWPLLPSGKTDLGALAALVS